jgi:hypothetical protein
MGVQAYILIQTEVGKARDVAAAIDKIEGVVRVDAVTGEDARAREAAAVEPAGAERDHHGGIRPNSPSLLR